MLEDAENELKSDSGGKVSPGNEDVDHEDKSHSYLRAAEIIEYHHAEIDEEADERTDLLEDEDTSKLDDDSSKFSSEQQDEHEEETVTDSDLKEHEDYEDIFDDGDGDVNEIDDTVNRSVEDSSDKNMDNEDKHESDEEETEEDVSIRCWCDSLRKLDIEVPDEVTPDWLYGLSVATIPDNVKSSIPGLISELQEKIELDEPQEEFKQLRSVKPTDACSAAVLPYNRDKNRFRNVLPCKFICFY